MMKTLGLAILLGIGFLPLHAQTTITYTDGQVDSNNYSTTAPNDPTTLSITSGTATLSGVLSGNGSVIVDGGGTLIFDGVDTYTGATQVNAGTLAIGAGDISDSSGVNLAGSGATFDISNSNSSEVIQDLTGVAGSFINLGSNLLTVGTANSTTFAGVLEDEGMGELLKQGTGTLTLTGINTYQCNTIINEGTLAIGAGGSISDSCEIDLTDGATFDISTGGNQTVQDLFSGGGGTINLGANTLTAGTANSTYFDGVIQGTGGLTKQGAGTLTLSGTNTYSGATTVTNGTLQIDGSIANSATTATGGGRLQGTGTFGNITLNAGTTLMAGDDATTLNKTLTTGALLFNANATLQFKLDTSSGQSDLITVTGLLTLNNTNLDLIDLAPTSQQLAIGTQLTLIAYVEGMAPGLGSGSDLFSYNGVQLTEGSDFLFGANIFQINYAVGDPTITLTTVTPEPGTWALLLMGMAVLAILRGRFISRRNDDLR